MISDTCPRCGRYWITHDCSKCDSISWPWHPSTKETKMTEQLWIDKCLFSLQVFSREYQPDYYKNIHNPSAPLVNRFQVHDFRTGKTLGFSDKLRAMEYLFALIDSEVLEQKEEPRDQKEN